MLNDQILLCSFLKLLTILNQENYRDQVHIFQDTYFASSQIHSLTIMYHFRYKNHDILQKSLFQSFFFVPVIYISNICHA